MELPPLLVRGPRQESTGNPLNMNGATPNLHAG